MAVLSLQQGTVTGSRVDANQRCKRSRGYLRRTYPHFYPYPKLLNINNVCMHVGIDREASLAATWVVNKSTNVYLVPSIP